MLRLATRSSRQAVAQSEAVARAITAATGQPVELVTTDTIGDRRTDVPLHSIGGQGVFVKEVQQVVLDGHADLAVHSAKDLPSQLADGLVIGAFMARRTPNDALVGRALDELEHGAVVATGSVRRRAQLAAVRPDLQFMELRGNIDTRLSKVPDGGAIVMAVAALEILGLTDRIAEVLPVDRFVPAVGQGCVAVECRADAVETLAVLAAIDDPATRTAVEIERTFLAELGAGCSSPLAAHVTFGDAADVTPSADATAQAAADVSGAVLRTFLAGEGANAAQVYSETLPLAARVSATSAADADAGVADLELARAAARRAAAAVS